MMHTETTPLSSTEFFTQFNLNAFKKRWQDLNHETAHPKRTEVGELLFRNLQDKSLIDEWSSWWHDLSIFRKAGILLTVTSITVLVGTITGLTLPFIILTASILFTAHKLLTHHETHRRARSARFVEEVQELTQKLDGMLVRFKVIAHEMLKSLEQVEIQAVVMLNNNTQMTQQVAELDQEKVKLKEIVSTLSVKLEQMKQAQNTVTQTVKEVDASLRSVDRNLNHASHTLQTLDQSLDLFADAAILMRQTEENLSTLSKELNTNQQQDVHSELHENRAEEALSFEHHHHLITQATENLKRTPLQPIDNTVLDHTTTIAQAREAIEIARTRRRQRALLSTSDPSLAAAAVHHRSCQEKERTSSSAPDIVYSPL